MLDNINNEKFIQKISRNALINILDNANISSEIEELDTFISSLLSQARAHCLKFLKKDGNILDKFMPVTINRIITNVNTMLELVSPPPLFQHLLIRF